LVVLIAGVVAVILNLIIPPEEESASNIVEHPDTEGGQYGVGSHERGDEESIGETKNGRVEERKDLE
jgi:hypothetical protein